jgi:hypothetical protein
MKVEFEKNITVMKTLSYILIASLKIYLDYAKEIGISFPIKIFMLFTLVPVLYIFIYPLFKIVKRQTKAHEEYFHFLNELTIINFVVIGLFTLVLITMEFWHNINILFPLIYLIMAISLVNVLTVFLSLMMVWIFKKCQIV